MTSISDVDHAGGRLLDQLRATAASRPDMLTSAVFAEALLVAELLTAQSGATEDPAVCAEALRAGAMALAASRHSFTVTRDPSCELSGDDTPAIQHYGQIGECLLFMADTLDPTRNETASNVIDLTARLVRQ